MLASVKALLSSVVDYAGLFPPAKLSMREAMANYARYQSAPYSWMLGHFVLPASRLDEFEELLPTLPLKQRSLSVILSKDVELELDWVRSQNQTNSISIAALEFPPLPPAEIKKVLPHLPAEVDSFFEIPYSSDLEPYLAVLQGTGASAKIRTGGITADAFPSTTQLCQFIVACAKAQVPFKATAGLHHPLPANYRLTYEPNSASSEMHGFLNVAIAAAFVYWEKVSLEEALEVLQQSSNEKETGDRSQNSGEVSNSPAESESPNFLGEESALLLNSEFCILNSSVEGFQFKADSIAWSDRQLKLSELEEVRQHFFRSFGSCSFQEPIDDLKELKLL